MLWSWTRHPPPPHTHPSAAPLPCSSFVRLYHKQHTCHISSSLLQMELMRDSARHRTSSLFVLVCRDREKQILMTTKTMHNPAIPGGAYFEDVPRKRTLFCRIRGHIFFQRISCMKGCVFALQPNATEQNKASCHNHPRNARHLVESLAPQTGAGKAQGPAFGPLPLAAAASPFSSEQIGPTARQIDS